MSHDPDRGPQGLAKRALAYTQRRSEVGRYCPTPVDGFVVMQAQERTPLVATLYQPVVCLILQGSKDIELGRRLMTCGPGQSIIVSHTVPIQSRITRATPDEPYVAMILGLDVNLLRGLIDDLDEAGPAEPETLAIEIGAADPALIDAMSRLFALTDLPDDISVMAPLIVREIHFRLLRAQHGTMLRQLLRRESHASRISKAITRIRTDYAEPLAVPELARTVGMSESSFYEHFKVVTATTPLQYQKDLRLLEARRLLASDDRSVTDTAFTVGYQSATQFSREYSRKFGVPPLSDRSRTLAAV